MSVLLYRCFALVVAAVGVNAAAQSTARVPEAALVISGSGIAFTTRQMGVPVQGSFGKYSAQVALDPKKPESGKVSLVIDTASARFGAAETDAEVLKPSWFNSAKFPQATFHSSGLKATGSGRFDVTGLLTMKGLTQIVTIPVQVVQSAGISVVTGQFLIKRLDFRIGENEWSDISIVSNDVIVQFRLNFAGMPAL